MKTIIERIDEVLESKTVNEVLTKEDIKIFEAKRKELLPKIKKINDSNILGDVSDYAVGLYYPDLMNAVHQAETGLQIIESLLSRKV